MKRNDTKRRLYSCEIHIGKDEMNLAEFPFATLTRHGSYDVLVYEGWWVDGEGNRHFQRWVAAGNRTVGMPNEFDERVFVALMALSAQQGFASRKVSFRITHLLRILRLPVSQRSYELLDRSLKRLTALTIFAEGSFWDNDRKEWISLRTGFHILEKYWLRFQETDPEVRRAEPLSAYIVWGENIWRSIQAGYIKHLDLDLFFRLSSPLARRLYRFLSKRMAYQETYEIDIFQLAARLGMVRYPFPAWLRKKLRPAFEELVTQGFLAGYEFIDHHGYARVRFCRHPRSEAIARLVEDFSRISLRDTDHAAANVQQAMRLWHESGLDEEAFIELLYQAREITMARSGAIRKRANGSAGDQGLKNRAPYFFEVLRELIAARQNASQDPNRSDPL